MNGVAASFHQTWGEVKMFERPFEQEDQTLRSLTQMMQTKKENVNYLL